MDIGFQRVEEKRSILLTTSFQFSPQVQKLKETAIDKMLAQVLYSSAKDQWLRRREVINLFYSTTGLYSIHENEIKDALQRIALTTMRQIAVDIGSETFYQLSDRLKQEMELLQREAENRLDKVLNTLLENTSIRVSEYQEPFLYCLSTIFSHLGEEIVRLILDGYDETASPSIVSAVAETCRKFPAIDSALLGTVTIAFFRSNDPDYNVIKWNLGQNYYVAKALGLDPKGVLLSKEVFEGAAFFLDTNVLITALEPIHNVHQSFLAFVRACRHLNIELKTCQVSINEMMNWVNGQRGVLQKTINQIPDEMAEKVDSIFYEVYRDLCREQEEVCLDDVFSNFDSPINTLEEKYHIELQDDLWFDSARNKPDVQELARKIKSMYFEQRHKAKSDAVAIHDALLLKWVEKQRAERSKPKIWVVTMDTTLPSSVSNDSSCSEIAITLGALLQWMAPVANIETIDGNFRDTFAQSLRSRFLPQDKFFRPEDFLIFADMQMECKNLPVEDVEGCVSYLKTKATTLNPSKPKDREALYHHIYRYLADPARKFNQELDKYQRMLGDANSQIEGYRETIDDLDKKHKVELQQRAEDINQLKKQIADQEQKTREDTLRKSARAKYRVVVFLLFSLVAIVIVLASQFADGANLFQKIGNFWYFVIACPTIAWGFGRFYINKDEMPFSGWPYTKN